MLNLSAAQQEAARAQGYTGLGVGTGPAPAPKRGAHGGLPGQSPSKRSKTELAYEAWAKARTSVTHVQPHPFAVRFQVAKSKGYTPDLAVRYVDADPYRVDDEPWPCLLPIDLVEVKGTGSDGRPRYTAVSRMRAKLAAQALAPLGIRILTAWKVDGVWRHEVVPTRADP